MTALKNAADAMEACVTASIEFESAMAGVAKTTDLTQDELAAMGEDIKDLSTKIPLTTTELAKIAETAGQLGIANSALLEFTTVMAGLGVATNLTSEEAATMLAQFSAITGMDASFYENLGSTLVALGNNFATNEQRIADMSLAIAAAGNNAQMSEAEMMALSTAVTSVGIESATGGTQMSKLIMEMQRAVETGENLDAWAGAAGMSAAEFTQLWGKDAAAALTTFIGNLNNLDSSATVTLNTLGITETRMMQMITSLANAENQTGHLTSAIDTANMAWNENAALARETSLRYETTESKMTMLSNSVNNLGIAVGDKLTPATKRLADGGITVLDWLSDMVEESDALVPVTTAVLTGVVTLTAGLGVYVTVTKIATIATTLLGKSFLTFMATPAGIVIGVVALVASLAALAVTASDSATPSVKELTAATREMGEAFDDANATYEQNATATEAATAVVNRYITKLEELERSGLTSAESQREYHNTLALLCQVVPDLANYINLETDEIIGGTSALRANTEAWKANALAQAMQERVTAQYGAYADVLLEAERNSIELTRAQSDLDAIQQEHQSTIDHMNELYGEAEVKVTALSDEYGYMVDPMTQLDAEYFELEQSLQTYGDRMWEAQDRIDTYTEAVEDSEEYLSEYEEEIGLVEEAFDNLTSAQDSSTSSTEASNSAISGITTQIQQLALSYKEARDAAFDSINSQIGLFDSFAAEVSADTDTVEEMISRWAEQTANLASYTENLQKAAQYGLDEGLVQSLSDGSAESAGYLATIIQGVEDAGGSLEGMSGDAQTFVDSINTSFGENLQARNALSDEIAAAKIGLEEALSEIEEAAAAADFSGFADAVSSAFASVGVDADAAGINFSAGLSSGITEGTGAVTEAAGAAGQAAVDAANSAMGIASPSTVMYESGYNYGLGLANGITDSTALVTGAATLFGSSLNETMKQSSELSVTGFITKFAEIQTKTNAELTKLKTTVTTATASLVPQMNTIGVSLVDGLISGVNSRSGALAEAMASVVKSALPDRTRHQRPQRKLLLTLTRASSSALKSKRRR
ncbi:MAG: phage tail tape measure protein [Oscillospiraceae bacterium]